MTTKRREIPFSEICHARLGKGVQAALTLQRIVDLAEGCEKYCNSQVAEQDEYAKVYAEHMAENFNRILGLAQESLVELVNDGLARVECEQEKALNNIG